MSSELPPDLADLPARMTTSEVCALARYGQVTLWRRIKAGKMPAPVDRARESLFDRAAVLLALGVASPTSAKSHANDWSVTPDLAARLAAQSSERDPVITDAALKAHRAKLRRKGRL